MFELTEATEITITNANPRRELHGEEKVRAIDLGFFLKGENTLLDLIQPGLREHHFCNKAAEAHQGTLPDMLIPLLNIKQPNLPTTFHYQKGVKLRGYRFIWDYGMKDAYVDFNDAVLANIQYEIFEGGTVIIKATIQYNGDELADNDLYGELSGLASDEPIYIRLLAPGHAMPANKGYRAGRSSSPEQKETNKNQEEIEGEGFYQASGKTFPPLDPFDKSGEQQTPEQAFTESVTG